MDSVKTEANSSNRAHDQETQTNFEPDSEVPNGTLAPHRPTPPVERIHRGLTYRNPASWGGRYTHNPLNTYPDFYPYDARYTSMPPPPPVAPHGSHYFPSRTSPWHHYNGSLSPHSPRMMSHSSLHRYGYPAHMPIVPPVISSPHDPIPRHMDVDIARPKPEWPPGYRPVPKPPVPSEYLAAMHRGIGSEFGGPPSTATSLRSTVLDFHMPQSFRSPIGSARMSRKRALSNTPSSVESIDLNALIRTSPDSLLGYLNGMRSSSAGSFGHLSPGPFCTSPGSRQGVSHYQCCNVRHPFITPPPIPALESPTPPRVKDTLPSSTTEPDSAKDELANKPMNDAKSPQESREDAETSKDVAMDTCPLDSTTSPGASDSKTVQGASDNEMEEGEEQDLGCHWKDCSECAENQEELVKHVNMDHIKKEKKDFTCYWQGCSRGQKPFKAQYMLVVHMRRHTGEKPHKCTYAGCPKAYSRLENLKTHLRSHTGERPYVCEVEGCTKAFSNASDRAKHQNRTHSSVKPYICKVPGCPKRYTDPSSLRKHTKTVHGEQGIKRLKSEGSRDKPSHNQDRKQSAPPGKPNHQLSNASQNNATNYGQSGGKSPGRESVNSSGVHLSHGTVSCESDLVSSSCDTASCPLDIPGGQDTLGGASLSASHPTLSPRSPSPYINNLPDILEGDWEPTTCGNVMTEQVVATRAHPQSITLPKIETHSRDVAKWVNDVHRRMSEGSRRSSEASHLSVDDIADNNASRRSSESGWSSYNDSRRSSQASPFPQKNIAPVIVSRPPNMLPSQYGVSPQGNWPNLHLHDRTDTSLRRGSDISTGSYPSSTYNRLSRNSSGYGSQSNLALIRGNQIFHKFSPPAGTPTLMRGCNRRQSDTVICEADSSSNYLSNGGKKEIRRSSEPARHLGGISPRHKPAPNQSLPVDNLNVNGLQERELISHDFDPTVDPTELDAYLTPQQPEEIDLNSEVQPASMQIPQQTQRLRHYPYAAEEGQYDQHQPRQEAASQTIHHRPSPPVQPMPIAHVPHPHAQNQDMIPVRNPAQQQVQPNLWQQRGHIQQKLWSYKQQQQQQGPQQHFPPQGMCPEQAYMDPGYNVQLEGYKGLSRDATNPSYEELMVNGMGALSTENERGAAQDFLGNGNMVVSDMNSLLTSLLEEDKYLEMKQSASRGMPGSAMSIF